jgi:magnesium chelatase family protein
VAERVQDARSAATLRWVEHGWSTNADAIGATLRERRWRLPRPVMGDVEQALDRGWLSARGYDRVIRIAWTVADLAGHATPSQGDVREALQFRVGTATVAA